MVDARGETHGNARRAAEEIVRTLAAAGHVAYFAGGCVRDELLGVAPEDYDVATDATPERLATLFRRTAHVGASFGVVLVKLYGATVEVATFRSDGAYTDKRRPDSVTFSDPVSDAQRRDFTVNAIFLDPLGTPAVSPLGVRVSGAVVDHVGGLEDLRRRVLRAVGDPDRRLAEDHLRALRAVRLAAKLGFALDADTAGAIKRHARELSGVSRERIGDELRRIFGHPSRSAAIGMAQELGLDGPILDGPCRGEPPRLLAGLSVRGDGPESIALCLAAWVLDRGYSPAADEPGTTVTNCRRALCLSNEESDSLRSILSLLKWIEGEWRSTGVSQKKRRAATSGFASAMELAGLRAPELGRAVTQDLERLSKDGIGIHPPPFVTGDRLVALGMQPGPAFKRILDTVYDAQLEGRVRSPEEGLELARRLSV